MNKRLAVTNICFISNRMSRFEHELTTLTELVSIATAGQVLTPLHNPEDLEDLEHNRIYPIADPRAQEQFLIQQKALFSKIRRELHRLELPSTFKQKITKQLETIEAFQKDQAIMLYENQDRYQYLSNHLSKQLPGLGLEIEQLKKQLKRPIIAYLKELSPWAIENETLATLLTLYFNLETHVSLSIPIRKEVPCLLPCKRGSRAYTTTDFLAQTPKEGLTIRNLVNHTTTLPGLLSETNETSRMKLLLLKLMFGAFDDHTDNNVLDTDHLLGTFDMEQCFPPLAPLLKIHLKHPDNGEMRWEYRVPFISIHLADPQLTQKVSDIIKAWVLDKCSPHKIESFLREMIIQFPDQLSGHSWETQCHGVYERLSRITDIIQSPTCTYKDIIEDLFPLSVRIYEYLTRRFSEHDAVRYLCHDINALIRLLDYHECIPEEERSSFIEQIEAQKESAFDITYITTENPIAKTRFLDTAASKKTTKSRQSPDKKSMDRTKDMHGEFKGEPPSFEELSFEELGFEFEPGS